MTRVLRPWIGTQVALRVDGLTGRTGHTWLRPLLSDNGPLHCADGSALWLVPRAQDAVAVALALPSPGPFPDVGLSVAVHVGEVMVHEGGAVSGPLVEELAALVAIAGPGRAVCSDALFALAEGADGVDEEAWFEKLGHHALRAGRRPQAVWRIRHVAEDPTWASPRSDGRVRPEPPVVGTSFVGREEDLRELRSFFEDPLRRLVTIVGPGGCGKTRLAAELVSTLRACCGEGLFWADLAGCHDALDSARAVLDVVRCREEPGRSTTETVCEFIGEAHSLLILDNCEHLVDVMVPVVGSLLAKCPNVRLLVTSREPLGLAAEWPWRIAPLPCPPLGELGQISVEELAAFAAVQLFVARARQVRPTFALTHANRAAVGEVCAQLDGIPLAIELAAARVRWQSPARIAAELDDRFRVLRGGSGPAASRHATMLASVEWSYGLLDDVEQAVFRRLAVFPGTFSLEAAEAVAADGFGIEPMDVLDVLCRLMDRSMVIPVDDPAVPGEARFRLLETMRQFGLGRCIGVPELSATRDRHLRHYLTWIENLDGRCPSDETQDAIERDYPNLRSALEWSPNQPALALRLLAQLALSWANLGHYGDARRLGRPILDRGPGSHPELWAIAVGYLFDTLMFAGDETVLELLPQAMEIATSAGDHGTMSYCHSVMCIFGMDDPAEHATAALAHARACDDRLRFAVSVLMVSLTRTCAGYLEEVAALRREGLDAWRSIGNRSYRVQCALLGAMEPTISGDIDRAVAGTLADAAHLTGTVEPCSMSMCASGLAHVGMLAEREDMVARGFELLAERGVQSAVAFVPSEFAKCRIVAALRAGGQDIGVETVRELVVSPWANWYEELGHAALLGCERFNELEMLMAERPPGGPYPACRWELSRAHLALQRGDLPAAEGHARAAFGAALTNGYGLVLIDALETLASLSEDRVRFSRLLGFAAKRRSLCGYRFRFPHLARALGARLANLEPAAYAAAEELEEDQAVAWVMRTRGTRQRPSFGWASLTPTERRVVQLIVAGHTNPQIGERLLMSRSTVKTHLAHIFAKLHVRSRAQLAALASSEGAEGDARELVVSWRAG